MTPEIAKAIHTFLGRATIQGNEVGVFVRCLQTLEQIVYQADAGAAGVVSQQMPYPEEPAAALASDPATQHQLSEE